MRLVKAQIDYYLTELQPVGITDQSKFDQARAFLANDGLSEECLDQIRAALPAPPKPLISDVPEFLPLDGLPGYLVDKDGIPWADRRFGRKGGQLKALSYTASKGRGRRNRWLVCRYQFSVDGRRVKLSSESLIEKRALAEKVYREKRLNPPQGGTHRN